MCSAVPFVRVIHIILIRQNKRKAVAVYLAYRSDGDERLVIDLERGPLGSVKCTITGGANDDFLVERIYDGCAAHLHESAFAKVF